MAVQFRFVILLLCVTASTIAYITRQNINIAIVSMVEDVVEAAAAKSTSNKPSLDICPTQQKEFQSVASREFKNSSRTTTVSSSSSRFTHRYSWDQSVQGIILGSFFYTYILFQMPSGILAEKFGGRWIIVLTLLGSGLVNALTPFITDFVMFVILSRLILGAVQAGVYPAAFSIICRWMPLKDRSFAFALLEGGACIGSIIAYFTSGFLSNYYGWPSVFYLAGGISLTYTVIFALFSSNEPEGHRCVTDAELQLIHQNGTQKETASVGKKIPWVAILTNKAVMTAAFFKFGLSWTFLIMAVKLPAYLNDIIREDITSNGVINAFMNVLASLTMACMGFVSERVIEQGWLSRTHTRKMFSIFSGAGSGLCTLMIPFAGCNRSLLLSILFMGSVFLGCGSGSDIPLPSEMSKNFPATIYSLLNMIAMSAGFIAPSFCGYILDAYAFELRQGWSLVFYSTSGLSFLATAIFLSFASAERQPFDFIEDELEEAEAEEVKRQVSGRTRKISTLSYGPAS